MNRRALLRAATAAGTALAIGPVATLAHADAGFPAKPIRLIVPFPPGGGTDILSRLIANELATATGWTVVPDNRGGAGGTIGLAEAARAKPTGYDIVMGQKDNMIVAPWLYPNLSYDPNKDFAAVAHVAYTPVVIVTRSESPYKTLDDVVKAARKSPDSVTYGSPGNGTTIHLAGEQFKNAAKVQIRHVPYKGSNAAMMDVMAGNVDLMVSSVPSAIGQLKSGKLRALAVTSARRSSVLPDTPTVAELGFGKDFDVSTWYGLFAPAGTPADIVTRINAEVNKLLAKPEVQAAIQAQGAEYKAMSPQQFAAQVADELPKWKAIVQASGARIE
ncbi:tripartite tricarboxylate transporter substrate binding protein [Variovorax dokdonensis]|uniref:Tripartite tricarboxylate transporter substrate binding protein n=1 Tax=Variovorax dokdonensis TaxID=344883 RepID=A0ABT7NCJ4_9BURK|nr:tripartite tricarboxylate transporter substrate binding protein [Variovorax dokdonensis]MDM0045657.1 tripartite tricarboxylate transporter substrate binding protein [Variovorax dokdonensis]